MEKLGFTKLVVGDLQRCAAFYETVFGLKDGARYENAIDGRPMSQIIYGQPDGAMNFVLLAFHDAPEPLAGEVIVGCNTKDADAVVARAVAAGGSLVTAPAAKSPGGPKFGFIRDVEGHMIEVVQAAG